MDREARKELLLTRIALERAQWLREVDELRRVAQPRRLIGDLVRASVGESWPVRGWRGLRDRVGRPTMEGGLDAAHGVIERLARLAVYARRHPTMWSLVAGAWPWLRARRWGRSLLAGGAGAGLTAAAAWWLLQQRRPPEGD